ncbi:peptidoglycan-binding domain-containing protein [Rhizobium sp.]
MATQPKRKSPDTGTTRSRSARARAPAPSRAKRMLMASGALIARHPRTLGGLVVFGVVFSFIAANAMWYQPRRHPAPFMATRAAGDETRVATADEAIEPGVTVFRIEREADKPKPSELVRRIQLGLAARGLYNGPADGLTGPKTDAAILFFEQTEGMDETGEPSQAILARLDAVAARSKANKPAEARAEAETSTETDADLKTASTKPASDIDEVAALIDASEQVSSPVAVIPAARPASPALVMKIQRALAGMAYADVKVDGIPGDATRAAIRAFEKSYRLPVTGEPSDVVLNKLKAIGAI